MCNVVIEFFRNVMKVWWAYEFKNEGEGGRG